MFVKVAQKDERDFIFAALILQKRPIQIQLSNKKIVTARAFGHEGQDLKLNVAYVDQFRGDQGVTVTFSVAPDIFFMKSDVVDMGNHYVLRVGSGLHKLQRRNSFRLQVPDSMDAKVMLRPIKGVPRDSADFKKPFRLVNVSGGGFSIELPVGLKFLVKKDDLLEFTLELAGEFKKQMKGRVRQIFSNKEEVSKVFRIGVEFIGIKKSEQEQLIQLVTSLYRKYFKSTKFG